MLPIAPDRDPPPPGTLRSPTGRGRPYPAGTVTTVRMLVETTALRLEEIAAQEGVHEATVGRWVRRFGWQRPGAGGDAPKGSQTPPDRSTSFVMLRSREAASRSTRDGGSCFETARSAPPQQDDVEDPLGPSACGAQADRVIEQPYRRYSAADRDGARLLIERTHLGLEAIGLRLGVSTPTLFRWKKQFRWQRPSLPTRPGPHYYRSRRRRGRPYAADAIGTAQRLVTQTLLSQKRIAAQAGVSQATVSNWIKRRGWTRPEPEPWSHRFAASRRTAPLAVSGDRRGGRYAPDIVEQARQLYRQTELPTAIVAARVKVSAVTVARWAKEKGWTRTRDQLDVYGRLPRKRRR